MVKCLHANLCKHCRWSWIQHQFVISQPTCRICNNGAILSSSVRRQDHYFLLIVLLLGCNFMHFSQHCWGQLRVIMTHWHLWQISLFNPVTYYAQCACEYCYWYEHHFLYNRSKHEICTNLSLSFLKKGPGDEATVYNATYNWGHSLIWYTPRLYTSSMCMVLWGDKSSLGSDAKVYSQFTMYHSATHDKTFHMAYCWNTHTCTMNKSLHVRTQSVSLRHVNTTLVSKQSKHICITISSDVHVHVHTCHLIGTRWLPLRLHCHWKLSQNDTVLKLHCAGHLLVAFTLQSL